MKPSLKAIALVATLAVSSLAMAQNGQSTGLTRSQVRSELSRSHATVYNSVNSLDYPASLHSSPSRSRAGESANDLGTR